MADLDEITFTGTLMLIFVVLLIIGIIATVVVLSTSGNSSSSDFKKDPEYIKQVQFLSSRFKEVMGTAIDKNISNPTAKKPVEDLVSDPTIKNEFPPSQQSLVNFYALGTRFTGYMGPMMNGYFDPDTAVQLAVQAGSRVFVLEIDYLEDCINKQNPVYYPQIVVRDIQGKLIINPSTYKPLCESGQRSSIQDVCEKINTYAFSSSSPNASDPVIVVLYFLRQPPGPYNSKTVLDYYSRVAKAVQPLKNRFVVNEISGGNFYRQQQPERLLINKITNYTNKVLVFSNANTNGFREITYPTSEDLDFIVNLRLMYTQTKLGVTENDTGAIFGILQTAEDYMQIPEDRTQDVVDTTKMRWTICLSNDPSIPVNKRTYDKITKNYGVNCVPIQLFDKDNDFMFTDKTFKIYSYQPKPEALRYIKPGVVLPGKANPSMNAKGGMLNTISIGQ
jgi:type II secretory pathway pseudopilin PulG